MGSDGEGLIGLWFDGQKYFGDTLREPWEEQTLPIFGEVDQWLNIYFSGKAPEFTPKLAMRTTAFRRMVWEILFDIPFGQTMTYGQIARIAAQRMGIPRMSGQAVGGAVGHNAFSLIIPCHRVVGTGGSMTGYAGGIERKIRLLEIGRAHV